MCHTKTLLSLHLNHLKIQINKYRNNTDTQKCREKKLDNVTQKTKAIGRCHQKSGLMILVMMMTMMPAKGYDVSSRDIYGKTTATLPASCPPCALHIVHIHGRSALFSLHCAHTWTITNCTCTHICLKVFCTHCKRLSNGYFVHYGKEVQCGECGAGLRSHDNMDWGPHVS